MDKITYIPLKEITPNKRNLRSNTESNDLAELAESIKAVGLINPITVRDAHKTVMDDAPDGFKYEIVSGERRFKAAEIAGLKEIPAIVKKLTDDQTMEIIIIENLQRKEIHPLDEASGFEYLLKSGKYNEEAIGDKIGKSASFVTKRLKLLSLVNDVKRAFRNNELTLAHALEFARLNDDQQNKMLKWMSNHSYSNPTAARLKEAIRGTFYLNLNNAVFDVNDDMVLDDLPAKHKYFGALSCKMCPKRTGYNKNLFDDVADDVCTDPECYKTKVCAHIKKTIEAYQKKGKTIIEYQHIDAKPSKESVYTKQSGLFLLEKRDKKCPSVTDAIITKIEPYNYVFKYQVGDIIKVCNDPECKVHRKISGNVLYSSNQAFDAKIEEKRKKENIEYSANELARGRAVKHIYPKIEYPLDDAILDELVDRIIDNYNFFDFNNVCEFFPKDEIKKVTDNHGIEEFVQDLESKKKIMIIVSYLIWSDHNVAEKLYDKYGVDFKQLMKDARKEVKKQKGNDEQ
jgi:ParB family chromosome partitioning protein